MYTAFDILSLKKINMNASFLKRSDCLNTHRSKFTSVIKSILLFFAIFVYGAYSVSQTYEFSSSDVIALNKDVRKVRDATDKLALVIQKKDNNWFCQFKIGVNPGPVWPLISLKKELSSKNFKFIHGVGKDFTFEIYDKKFVFYFQNDRISSVNESSGFVKQFVALYAELDKSYSSVVRDSHKGYSSSGNNRKDDSRNKLFPSSGNLTAITFANHPFGFMPQGPLPQSEACVYLRRAGWPSDPYDSSLISIISSTQFKIPFKMYGKDVMSMYMSWYNGENKGYDLEVSDYKTRWTKNDAICLAQKMYEELINNEYSDIEVRYTYSGNFYQKAVTNGSVYIQIEAHECSTINSWDSFGVCMNVYY